VAARALLALKDTTPAGRDLLDWKWLKGSVTPKSDFGDPLSTDTYELCIYDGTPNLIMHATAPAGGLCHASRPKPCWKEKSSGFTYTNLDLTPFGLQRIVLKAGLTPGAAKITVHGKGTDLAMPASFPLVQPVVVQLKNSSGTCWEATYDAPAAKDTAGPPGQFKDKAD
jgi:hypothetical protein